MQIRGNEKAKENHPTIININDIMFFCNEICFIFLAATAYHIYASNFVPFPILFNLYKSIFKILSFFFHNRLKDKSSKK